MPILWSEGSNVHGGGGLSRDGREGVGVATSIHLQDYDLLSGQILRWCLRSKGKAKTWDTKSHRTKNKLSKEYTID